MCSESVSLVLHFCDIATVDANLVTCCCSFCLMDDLHRARVSSSQSLCAWRLFTAVHEAHEGCGVSL